MQKIKERLFGITVLVSLAIIFVPMLISGNNDQKLNLTQNTPNQPNLNYAPKAHAQLAHYQTSIDENLPSHRHDSDYGTAQSVQKQTTKKATSQKSAKQTAEKATQEKIATMTDAATPKAVSEKAPVSKEPIAKVIKEPLIQGSGQTATTQDIQQSKIVQLATFGNPNNASSLITKLTKDGYTAYSQSTHNNLTVVYVSPTEAQSSVNHLTAELYDKYNLKGRVVNKR